MDRVAKGTFWLPKAGSTLAGDVDAGWALVYGVSVVMFLLVVTTLVVFVVRYRRRPGQPVPDAPDHSTGVEIAWTVVPIGIVLVLFGVGFRGYLKARIPPADAMEVQVTAERWLWTFVYANGARSVGELRVPVGRPVKLVMSSKDVVHSFFVPEFRVKQDVVPGRYTTLWFEATDPGEVVILCSQYCGTGHSEMMARLVVMDEAGFAGWLEGLATEGKELPPARYGEQLFARFGCAACHAVDGSRKTGPSLKAIFGREEELTSGAKVAVDEAYLRESIVDPGAKVVKGYQPVMPTFKGLVNDRQMDAIVAYLKSLE